MRVRFGGTWIADSEQVVLLFEPGRYPVAYFPETDISPHALERTDHSELQERVAFAWQAMDAFYEEDERGSRR